MGKHFNKKRKKIDILSFFMLIFILGIAISVIYISKWFVDNMKNKELEKKISTAITITNDENGEEIRYNVDFDKLKDINNDTVGWLKVKGTNIEYAVVKSNNNSYYLNHNFEKEENSAGWIFADYRNKLDGTDKNIIIYGHNRKNNSMFGSLKNILTEEWYSNQDNLVIDFITKNEYQKYQVFSVYKIENEDYYINTEFIENEFESFINTLKHRSIKDFNVQTSANDTILTLSTCADSNKYRVVLHAIRINK